jgi:hypothetical protein
MTHGFRLRHPISPSPQFQFDAPAALGPIQAGPDRAPIVDFEPGTGVIHQTSSDQLANALSIGSLRRPARSDRGPQSSGQGYGDFAWVIYELPDPNLGQYSPTVVQFAHEAASHARAFAQPNFDWRRNVVLEQDPGPLVPAADAKLLVEQGYLRVEARSQPGRSLF